MEIKDTYFGWRLVVIFVLVMALFYSIVNATTTQVMFSSILLFLLPMILDYHSQQPFLKKNIKRKELAMWGSIFASAIFLVLIMFTKHIQLEVGIKIWKLFLITPFLSYIAVAIFDWIGYSSPDELAFRESLREVAQEISNESKIDTNNPSPN